MEFFWPVAILVMFGFGFLTWRRRKQQQTASYVMPYQQNTSGHHTVRKPKWFAKKSKPVQEEQASPLVTINLVAEKGNEYRSYDLLQAMSNVGLKYGLMKIFHRHETPNGEGMTLFSVASINKPGTFEMDNMGGFECPGLTMFADMSQSPDPLYTFDLMVDTAQQLIEQLGGSMFADQTTPMTIERIERMRDTLYNAYGSPVTA